MTYNQNFENLQFIYDMSKKEYVEILFHLLTTPNRDEVNITIVIYA